jgi:hypothetical protein
MPRRHMPLPALTQTDVAGTGTQDVMTALAGTIKGEAGWYTPPDHPQLCGFFLVAESGDKAVWTLHVGPISTSSWRSAINKAKLFRILVDVPAKSTSSEIDQEHMLMDGRGNISRWQRDTRGREALVHVSKDPSALNCSDSVWQGGKCTQEGRHLFIQIYRMPRSNACIASDPRHRTVVSDIDCRMDCFWRSHSAFSWPCSKLQPGTWQMRAR